MALLDHALSQLGLVAAIVTPTFILVVFHVFSGIREFNLRWQANQERRKQRKAATNARIIFDKRGVVVAESVHRYARLDYFERMSGHLHTLGEALAFGNPVLFKIHGSLKIAAEVCDRCAEATCAYLSCTDVDDQLISAFEPLNELLEELMDRKPPSGDLKARLNAFKEELAVVYAAFGSGVPSDPKEAVEEALLGTEKVRKGFLAKMGSSPSVPEFDSSPIPELVKRAKKAKAGPRGAAPAARLLSLEPEEFVEGVHVRGSGPLFWLIEQRDKFGIGSKRLAVSVIILLLALGPARFVGHVGAALVVGFAAVALGMEVLAMCDSKRSQGMLRRTAPVMLFAGLVLLLALQGFDNPPQNNIELEQKPTFLPLPPQYNLAIQQQRLYVPLIYGIMHANLAVVCLLPLPVCYYLQAQFVNRFPDLRWLVPQNPVWLHRMLGYALLGGISVTGMIWLLFQGQQCLSQKATGDFGEQACFAFDPARIGNPIDRRNGVDVFILRFHMVWPLIYSFIPLMIWDKYPEYKEEKQDDTAKAPAGETGRVADSKRSLVGASDQEEGMPLLSKRDLDQSPSRSGLARGICEILWGFLCRRIIDVCLLVGAAAGCLLIQEGNIDEMTPSFAILAKALIFLWPLIFVVLALQTVFKFRDFLRDVAGPALSEKLCLGRLDEWSQFLRRSWWEVAYFCHVAAYTLLVAGALIIRLQVFWPTLFTWSLYFYDRYMIFRCAQKFSTPILVGSDSSPSSYPVNKGEGATAEPSHVRLVLRRPEGFELKAGQWCQLALRQCGSYCGAPGFAKPFLQWHAFSIASTESDDFLEFHIAVHGSPQLLANVTEVQLASKTENVAHVSEKGNCFEWAFPHRVPVSGEVLRGGYTMQRTGIYFNLEGEDGTSIKILRPQLQWTGRLWNVVQWLLESHCVPGGSGTWSSGQLREHQEMVSIMGPYGTMPYTVSSHKSVMLIGAGVGFPSTGAMLRQLLNDNAEKEESERTAVCFIWTATKVDQLLLCFPSLLADLARYVSKKSLGDLKSWLTIKIFISSFKAEDTLDIDPSEHIFPGSRAMKAPLDEVRSWLLQQGGPQSSGTQSLGTQSFDDDGTYICQGSLGASFPDVLRKSVFIRDKVVNVETPLGICFCGPSSLGNWIRSDLANTILPVKVEYIAECAGD